MTIFNVLVACSASSQKSVIDSKSQYGRGQVYVVAPGDTLRSIARRYGLNYLEIARINAIKAPYQIYPSQKLKLTERSNESTMGSQSSVTAHMPTAKVTQNTRSNIRTNSASLSSKSSSLNGTVKWQWPALGKVAALFEGENGSNKGIDLTGNLGEPVLAAASGQVIYAGSGLSGYGKLLIIKHNEIFLSAYAHNNELLVKEGDFVKAGQKIADMGSSGTDRVKLHFEIRSEGNPVDPLRFLPKRN